MGLSFTEYGEENLFIIVINGTVYLVLWIRGSIFVQKYEVSMAIMRIF